MDKRHAHRVSLIQNLYSLSFNADNYNGDPKLKQETEEILANKEKYYEIIAKYAPRHPVETLFKIDKCVLMLALYELIDIKSKPPYKVVINEAVELSKELSGETSPSFVNAVLGAYIAEHSKLYEQ